MNAKQAKQITQENRINDTPRWIFDVIESVARDGEDRISFGLDVIKNPNALTELGYNVEVDGLEYVVTW